MPTVDAKGRIVLPQEVRERLGITPGTEVAVHEEDGQAVVEPEDDPQRIIDDLERMSADATGGGRTRYDELDAASRDHVDTVRRQADEGDE